MKTKIRKWWIIILGLVLGLSGLAGYSWALDDDVPFFAGALGMPNVLIIFDNSDSMQDVPYLKSDGNALRPGEDEDWEWRKGVKDADNDGIIDEDGSGNIDWDEYAHVSEDSVSMPGTIPLPIPGIGSLTSTVSNMDNPLAVYDTDIDWTASCMTDDSEFNAAYRYHILEVEGANGAKQYRTIEDRNTSLGCWYFSPTGAGSPERPLDFSNPPYTYTILSGLPGNVTWTESWGALNIVRDANIHWSQIDQGAFDNNYKDHILVVIAGTNAGESRKISGWSQGGKNWIVESGFPQSCDQTTQYKIIGSPEADERLASGGSHPASKLYQAKKALTAFLESDTIRMCDQGDGSGNCVEWRYLMNMGFATFMSARIAQVHARYYRKTLDGEAFWYETDDRTTFGNYGVSIPGTPEYIDPASLEVTPYRGYDGETLTPKQCPNPEPSEGNGDYTLVTGANAKHDVPVDSSGTIGNIVPNTYNNTCFVYPGIGTSSRPHAWSYRHTTHNYIYRQGTSTSDQSDWSDGIQGNPFFPATVGDEMANHTGDDQVVFVNLPEYDDAYEHKGDDLNGDNITKILNYISPARVQRPGEGYAEHDVTIMPHTSSIPPNETEEGTPLAASLEQAGKYYESYFIEDQFTQGDCRSNYVVLVTDGLETCGGDPVAAAAALNTELISGNPSSVVKTFVIGFGLDNAAKAALNAIAAAGGTDQAYFATNMEELLDVLANQITAQIIGDSFSRSSPVISRYLQNSDDFKLYYSYFDYPVWRGHLKAYNMNEDGSRGDPVAGWTGDCDNEAGNDGDAGCEIKTGGRGTVYTVADTSDMTRIEFSAGNVATLKPLVNPGGEDINGNGAADEDADAIAVIGYTLSPGYDGLNYVGSRDGGWPLGDIYNSMPVVVTGPKNSIPYWAGYNAFKSSHAGRPTMIYVGANDGMLHAIRDVDGREEWAYIPNSVLARLHEFKDGHRFTVDLTIQGADVDTSEGCDGTGWKSMVVSGLRKGGTHYYALDVTDPANPVPMWEMTDYTDDDDSTNDNMGDTWSIPSFGRLNIDGTTTSVIIAGGGLSDMENRGNRVYILNAGDGAILKEITVGSAANNIPSEIKTVRYILDFGGRPLDYITRSPVDSSLKGNIEVAYFGGTDGTLYKLTGLNADSDWDPQVEVLYRPPSGEGRPIYHRPEVADYLSCKKRFLLFGTGDESSPATVTQNYFYEIEDRPWDEDLDGEEYPDGSQGKTDGLFRLTWRETLALGEEVLSDPVFYVDAVYFTTYQPEGGCDMGMSYLYGLTTSTCRLTGREPGLRFNLYGAPLTTPEKKQEIGKGIATSPVITPPKMFIGHGDRVMEVPVPEDVPILLYWREEV